MSSGWDVLFSDSAVSMSSGWDVLSSDSAVSMSSGWDVLFSDSAVSMSSDLDFSINLLFSTPLPSVPLPFLIFFLLETSTSVIILISFILTLS